MRWTVPFIINALLIQEGVQSCIKHTSLKEKEDILSNPVEFLFFKLLSICIKADALTSEDTRNLLYYITGN
jgi:hypothetical protein